MVKKTHDTVFIKNNLNLHDSLICIMKCDILEIPM